MQKPLILIVDDEADVVTLWQRALIMEGFEVIPCFDGIGALDIAEAERPDLILLDLMMPMMSGFEACRLLKSNPQTKDIPVLCVTSAQAADVRQNVENAGAQGLLIKPFTTRELVAQINRFLAAAGPDAAQ
jgi:CheY-like chemotaxis protein